MLLAVSACEPPRNSEVIYVRYRPLIGSYMEQREWTAMARRLSQQADEAPTPRLREILAKLAADETVFANKVRADADDLMWDYD
jgi:hypothetical protein